MRPKPSRTWTGRVTVLTGLLVLATLLGGWRVTASTVDRTDPMTLDVGRTTYTVSHVERVTGLTADDLGGMTHGVQGLVGDDKVMLRVSLTIAAGDHRTTYDAGTLLLHSSASTHAIEPVGGSLGEGTLSAHARIEGAVSFVVPRNGARFVLTARGSSATVPLTKVDTAPPGADHSDMNMDRNPALPRSQPLRR
jgi:hypothetical protein